MAHTTKQSFAVVIVLIFLFNSFFIQNYSLIRTESNDVTGRNFLWSTHEQSTQHAVEIKEPDDISPNELKAEEGRRDTKLDESIEGENPRVSLSEKQQTEVVEIKEPDVTSPHELKAEERRRNTKLNESIEGENPRLNLSKEQQTEATRNHFGNKSTFNKFQVKEAPMNVTLLSNNVTTGEQGNQTAIFKKQLETTTRKLVKRTNETNTRSKSAKNVLLVTYWRAGSTFLGGLIQSSPDVFYSYEPLHYINVLSRIESPEQTNRSIQLIKSLFQCEMPTGYFKYINSRQFMKKSFTYFHKKNSHVWKMCQKKRSVCQQPNLYSSICKQFGVHLMKTVRMPLRATGRIIEESVHQDLKILFLIRDPRGIMASRANRHWCKQASCASASQLCKQMKDDLESFDKYSKLYPNTFYKIQFENFTVDVEGETRKLFRFLGMNFTKDVKNYIDSHTRTTNKKEMKDPYSTIRNSKSVVRDWQKKLNSAARSSISKVCSDVLDSLGYEH